MKEIVTEIKNIESSKKDLRNFGFIVGIGLLIFGGVLLILKKSGAIYILSLSPVLILSACFLPVFLKPFQKIWMSIAIILGWIMNHVILILFFYLIITPIALLARLFKKEFLQKKPDPSMKSYWITRQSGARKKEEYTRQF